jgi:hypothetical protein
MPHLMRVLVVLLLLEASDSHMLLSMAQGKCYLTCQERITRRRNRHRYILHISTADLQPAGSCEQRGVSALQGW